MSQNEPTDFITQSLNDLLKDLEDNLVNDKSGQRVIAESFFVGVFLPMFAGDENPQHKATPEMWFNVARSAFNEVTVVSDGGGFLFDVPALASQDAIKPLDGTGKDANMQTVTDMITTARLYAQRGPNVMQGIIANEMDKRSFLFKEAQMSADHIRRWNEIFARYDRPLLPVTGAVATNTTNHAYDPARDSTDFEPL
jgi:hypothetical protein